ncbi:hypothetical protein [Haladaptatus halobius]|uniref:hypothetical protein n=1 Tax=Haladaptatus halobius TaxID=2884875 RepID=UPI001D0A14EF|nr:hypothetical protein [Haladaptatus halobius]
MTTANQSSTFEADESIFKGYILDVRIIESRCPGEEGTRYRFEAPGHTEIYFDDPDLAKLYTDIYFDVNGFEEAGTGDRGVPPEIIQAGRDTLAAYFLTQPYTDINWVASYYGKNSTKIERYVAAVQKRAQKVRAGAKERGME